MASLHEHLLALGSSALPLLMSCAGTSDRRVLESDQLFGHNHAFAVFGNNNHLIHSPIPHLRRALEKDEYSDVYLICHGWDYRYDEAFEAYRDHGRVVSELVDLVRGAGVPIPGQESLRDPSFNPFIISVVWSSTTAPLSSTVESILPYDLPAPWTAALEGLEKVVFVLPNNWGESVDSRRIALGRPKAIDSSELRRSVQDNARSSSSTAASVSELLQRLIEIKRHRANGIGLHAVGHSYGGKIVSLATLDACARTMAVEAVTGGEAYADQLVDSMILIKPALHVAEIYEPFELRWDDADGQLDGLTAAGRLSLEAVARRIGSKVILYSPHDSANGWLFSLSQLVLHHDIVDDDLMADGGYNDTKMGRAVSTVVYPLAGIAVLGWGVLSSAVKNVASLVVDPAVQVKATFTESTGARSFLANLALVPVAPFRRLTALGSSGLANASNLRLPSANEFKNWLTESSDYLAGAHVISQERFQEIATSGVRPYELVRSEYVVCNAGTLYNGAVECFGKVFGSIVNQLLPNRAHGDFRRDELNKGFGVTKRWATLLFVYNVSRAAREASAQTDNSSESQKSASWERISSPLRATWNARPATLPR